MRWKLTSRPEPSPRFVSDVEPSKPPSSVEGDELRVTLINHSTVLLQQSGSHILTDPIWSERASPLAWIGPRRRRIPGVRWEDLPRIDIVLLSHNHYDHLDLATLRRLADRGAAQFIVPSGVARLLRSQGIGPVHELDWGESLQLAETVFTAFRLAFFGAGTLRSQPDFWCGYMLEAAGRNLVYFAGDTAFGGHFATIRDRFGPPRSGAAADRRLRAALVYVACSHGSRGGGTRPSDPGRGGPASPSTTAPSSWRTKGLDTPKKRLRECAPGDSFLVLDNGQSALIVR